MLHDDFLNVVRIYIRAAADDHVLLSVHQIEKSVFVGVSQVARMEPAINNRLGSQIRSFVIFRHEQWPAPDDLPNLSGSQVLTLVVYNPHFEKRLWRSDGLRLGCELGFIENGDESFRQAVELIESARQAAIQLVFMFPVQGGANGAEHFEGLECFGRKVRRAQESDNLRWHHHDVSHTLSLDCFHKCPGIEALVQDICCAEIHRWHERYERTVEND